MRNVPAIWEAWKSAAHVGAARPATRVTVEQRWRLQTTPDVVVGLWTNGPARWFQELNPNDRVESEVPNVISVNLSRSIDGDGSCDLVVANVRPPRLGQPESPPGQFGDAGYYTWDHGQSQEARARWGHAANAWNDVLVPNALIRTYQGFGGHDKTIPQAIADEHIVLNGVWLVDDVTVNTDGTISVKCRDMAKLLIDQQLFPPLVPMNLYPLLYQRWITKTVAIPKDPAGGGDYCNPCRYLGSSADDMYGEFNTAASGHPGSDAFDISDEVGPPVPGFFAHQRSYWLSESRNGPDETVWIEFEVLGGLPGDINEIYYHAWEGNYRIMVSVMENGSWVPPESSHGGITPEGLPFVGTFTPVWEGGPIPGQHSNRYPLPRDFRATRIRLTVTNLSGAAGGWRAGARKIMACFATASNDTRIPPLVFAGASVPVNDQSRVGYWQVRANGQVYAFADARTYEANSPSSRPQSTVIGMVAHPAGNGYWYVDITGRVVSAGDAQWFGDLSDAGVEDVVDIAPTPTGDGYWLLRNGGAIHSYGDAIDQGVSSHTAFMPTGAPAIARSLESHPTTQGYWILWTDGYVSAHNTTHYGDANRAGFTYAEYVASIRRTSTGGGYWVTSGNGIVQAFGDALHKGNANPPGLTYAGDKWYKGLCWDLLPSPIGDAGYAIQRADGHLERKGDTTGLMYGSIGDGTATIRYDGNYKDYADIVRDLLLWAGYLLHKRPQPDTERPDVFGNIENTGAWAEEKLPVDMFDKKPVLDSIRELRDIVGYVFFIDAEGGARFESPNWWTMGNFLIDGTPYPHLPEVDEAVNLTGHSIVFSGASARSEIIIATEDPQPKTAGGQVAKGITQTRITPRTAPDLRGLIVPAMWTNQKFLKPDEQRIMADLIDMRMWFARRTAQASCVANPLIDVNDQVRVIERQTGEVFVHYVKSISFSHDLESGDFTMDLQTHWLGGSPYGKFSLFYSAAVRPQGDGYWLAALGGTESASKGTAANAGVYAYGSAELYDSHQDDSHVEIIISMRATPTGEGYYTVDESGKVLTYGDAVHQGEIYRGTKDSHEYRRSGDVTDMALTPTGDGYWLLQKNGTVTPFGDAVYYGSASPTGNLEPDHEVFAHSIESHPIASGYWVLSTDGTINAFNLPDHGSVPRSAGIDYLARLRRTADGDGYFVGSAQGTVQARGDAVLIDPDYEPPLVNHPFYNYVWALLVNPDNGYGQMRSDGTIIPHNFPIYSAVITDSTIQWALVAETDDSAGTVAFGVSPEVMNFLAKTASPSANNAVAANFSAPAVAALEAP
jgi:hypothetical protein